MVSTNNFILWPMSNYLPNNEQNQLKISNPSSSQSRDTPLLKIKKIIKQDHTNKNNVTPQGSTRTLNISYCLVSIDIETNKIIENPNLTQIHIKKHKIHLQNKTTIKVYACKAKFVYEPLSHAQTIHSKARIFTYKLITYKSEIYSHPQTDCYIVSQLFSVARHTRYIYIYI